ncbi:MAG: hypothetical protein KJN62_07835 [Deltaproteobacteria bacterium]|nr:hypothetical protein [Deltaproteobacteria bacterium]
MMKKIGRPPKPADKKKKLIGIKLTPAMLAALDQIEGSRTAAIEHAIRKTYKLKGI